MNYEQMDDLGGNTTIFGTSSWMYWGKAPSKIAAFFAVEFWKLSWQRVSLLKEMLLP